MRRGMLMVMGILGVAAAAVAGAQPAAGPAGQGDFVPVNSLPAVEQLPAAPFVIGAYAFVWVALLAYVWFIWRRMRTIEQELADLNRRMKGR